MDVPIECVGPGTGDKMLELDMGVTCEGVAPVVPVILRFEAQLTTPPGVSGIGFRLRANTVGSDTAHSLPCGIREHWPMGAFLSGADLAGLAKSTRLSDTPLSFYERWLVELLSSRARVVIRPHVEFGKDRGDVDVLLILIDLGDPEKERVQTFKIYRQQAEELFKRL